MQVVCKWYGLKDDSYTMYSRHVQQNVPVFITNWPKLANLWSQIQNLASDKQFQEPPLL